MTPNVFIPRLGVMGLKERLGNRCAIRNSALGPERLEVGIMAATAVSREPLAHSKLYSSNSYLTNLPASVLKLDHSAVAEDVEREA